MDYSQKEAAALLGITPPTLRKWSEHFDALLSDSARQALTSGGSTTSRRYTEADLAIFQRAKTLMWSGHTYDQTLHELAGDQPTKRSDDQVDIRHRSRASSDYATRQLPMIQPAGKQSIRKEDERLAAPNRQRQAQQGQLHQFREYMLQLQAEKSLLRERRLAVQERFAWRFSNRIVAILAICACAVLVALGIAWLGNPGAPINGRAALIASTALPMATASSTNSIPLKTTPPLQLTPGTVLAQASATISKQQASPVGSSPQPLPTTAPIPTTAPSVVAVVPTTGPASPQVILLQVAEAEAALRTGHLEATISYGSGQRSSAEVSFDLGDEQHVPRFHITSTYQGATSVQTTERVMIGDQSWERQQAGQWIMLPAQETALKQLQVFLPRTDSILDVQRVTVESMYVLHWYDAARDADVTLRVDGAGIPQQLRRVSRANGLVLTVTYSGWNKTVEIAPPA